MSRPKHVCMPNPVRDSNSCLVPWRLGSDWRLCYAFGGSSAGTPFASAEPEEAFGGGVDVVVTLITLGGGELVSVGGGRILTVPISVCAGSLRREAPRLAGLLTRRAIRRHCRSR